MTVEILVSPAERPPITNLGPTLSHQQGGPELYGVDIMWETPFGKMGVQRKEQADLVASTQDDRLGKEIIQMQTLEAAWLVIEGTPAWDRDGMLMSQYSNWSLARQWGVEESLQRAGIIVLHTRTALETCGLVERLAERTQEAAGVSGLLARKTGPKKKWGKISERDMCIHVMTGVPDVGVELAARLYDHFGGNIIGLKAGITIEQLTEVKGVGKKKAELILAAFS